MSSFRRKLFLQSVLWMLMLMLLKRLPHLTATLTTSHEEEEGGAGPLTVEGWIDLREQIDSYREGRGGPALTVRKEVREMTCSEWEAFVTAMKELKAAPQWAKYASPEDEEEQQIIWDLSHSDARQDLFTFLPWHRLWLREVERELQKIDPYVTIPYWNWALDSADPLRSPVLSDMYFGGNGDPSYNHCVLDGAFKTEKKEEARDIMANNGTSSSSCIQRTFPEKSGGLLSLLNVKDILVGHEDFESLNLCLENCPGMYGYMNVWMGGKGEKHPSDPLFLSLVAYIDMLWWKWQRMHNSLNVPGFMGDRNEILLPFDEPVEDVFSTEEMGYTYSSGEKKSNSTTTTTTTAEEERSCYLEKGGGNTEDMVLLGHQIFSHLPNNVSELERIPRKAPLLNVDVWRKWMQVNLNHHHLPTKWELEKDLEMWARLSSWPSLNMSEWNSEEEDYALGLPVRLVLGGGGGGGHNVNVCGHELSLEDKAGGEDELFCVVSRPKAEWYLNVFRLRIEEELERRESSIGRKSSNTTYAEAMKEAEQILTSVLFHVIEPIVAFEDERVLDNMWVIMEDLLHLLEQEQEKKNTTTADSNSAAGMPDDTGGGGKGKVVTLVGQEEEELESVGNGTEAEDQASAKDEDELLLGEEEAVVVPSPSYAKAMEEVETIFAYAYRDFARRNRRNYRLQFG